jgi:trehalose 6-phosphate synthase/phosphatase
MRERVRTHDVIRWAQDFVDELADVKALQADLTTARLRGQPREQLLRDYRNAESRLLVFDYDGTLVRVAKHPEGAVPSESLMELLRCLAADPGTAVGVLSGRRRQEMSTWFGELGILLGAEHGIWSRGREGKWERVQAVTNSWKGEVRSFLELYARRTPGARVEEKEYSLLWDYRGTKREFAEVRVAELLADLGPVLHSHVLDVLRGDGFVEIKSAGVSEAAVVSKWLSRCSCDFVLCAGDDASDEEVFAAVSDDAYTIRIGGVPSRARFSLRSPQELVGLLEELVKQSPCDRQPNRFGARETVEA